MIDNIPLTDRLIISIVITFLLVVTMLPCTGLMDEHWMPASDLCSLCSPSIKYDFVVKFENLDQEEKYLTERLGIDKIVLRRWENKNTFTNHTTSQV